MEKDLIIEAAGILVKLRNQRVSLEKLPEHCRPRDEKEAYAIQDELHRQFSGNGFGKRIGYKIGCTTSVMQSYMSIDHPCVGGILEEHKHYSPVSLDYNGFKAPGVEC